MDSELVIVPAFLIFWGFVVSVVFNTVRRYKSTKLQAEIQNKLLDKFGSTQDLLSYVQSEAGRRFVNSLIVEERTPYGRILAAVQASVLLSFFGGALLFLRGRVSGYDEGLLVFGTLLVTLGVGFLSSAAVSYFLSKSFGLLKETTAHH